MNNVVLAVTMRIDDTPPTVLCNRAAITPRETGGTELVSDNFPVLHVTNPVPGKIDLAPDTLALRRMFRFHFRDGHFPSAE